MKKIMNKLIVYFDLIRFKIFQGNSIKMDDDEFSKKTTLNVDLSALNNLTYEDFFETEDTQTIVIEIPKCNDCNKSMYTLVYESVRHSKCPCCKKTTRTGN